MKPHKPIRRVSAKRSRENAQRRRVIAEVTSHRNMCEAGALIATADQKHRCQRIGVDIHEPLTRARGGSITDPENMVVVCRACHDWIHHNPALATSLRLLVHSYENKYTKSRDSSMDNRRQDEAVDDELGTNLALSQASEDSQGNSGTLVLSNEASTSPDAESDIGSCNPVSDQQEVET